LIDREQAGVIILVTVFLFIGIAACGIAAIRGRAAGRVLVWNGVFNAMYGVRLFAEVPSFYSLLVGSFSTYAPQVVWMLGH